MTEPIPGRPGAPKPATDPSPVLDGTTSPARTAPTSASQPTTTRPTHPMGGPVAGSGDLRRPLLMDPAGVRPSGFAPPATSTDRHPPAASTDRHPPATPTDRHPPAAPTGQVAGSTDARAPARQPPASPWAPGVDARSRPAARPHTPSVLAGPTPTGTVAGHRSAPVEPGRPESAFGPVSRIVTVSVRTPSSRIDLALPDRTTMAEVLETVLELAPRSLREQALAHGGWILRTAGGRPLPGSTTLLDEGVAGGATVFLTGADTAEPTVVHDDLADAVADAVRSDTAAWPAGAGRAVALGSCAAFGVLAVLAVLTLGPPWVGPAVVLAGLTVAAQVVAGLVTRRRDDGGIALTVGLLSVLTGAAAATVAVAGSDPLTGLGPVPWIIGTLTAGVLAGTASVATGTHAAAFGAVTAAAVLLTVGETIAATFALGPSGAAALVCGLAVCLMPAVPSLSLRIAAFRPDPLPASTDELAAAARRTVDGGDSRSRTHRAVRALTALLHGMAWPTLAAGVLLALAGAPAGQALAAVVGPAMLLRARLFRTVGQRLPLLLCGVGCLLAVAIGLLRQADSTVPVVIVILVAVGAAVAAGTIAARRAPRSPAMARAAEIGDLLLTIAVIPLIAAVLGAFAFVRGLGG